MKKEKGAEEHDFGFSENKEGINQVHHLCDTKEEALTLLRDFWLGTCIPSCVDQVEKAVEKLAETKKLDSFSGQITLPPNRTYLVEDYNLQEGKKTGRWRVLFCGHGRPLSEGALRWLREHNMGTETY